MKKSYLILFVLFGLFITCPVMGQTPTFLSDIKVLLEFSYGQVTSLAEAIPEEKFDWRPAEGVRSVGESLLHVSSANYMLSQSLGLALPDGIDPMTLESSIQGKENILETVKSSMEFANKAISGLDEEQLNEIVELPFGKFSKRQLVLVIYDHAGEHKGQLIAYARANDITPPWSQD